MLHLVYPFVLFRTKDGYSMHPLFEKSKYIADEDRNLHDRTGHAFSQCDPSSAMIILSLLQNDGITMWHHHGR